MTIINLRGCNGSGKSSVAFDIMRLANAKANDGKAVGEIALADYETDAGKPRHVPGYLIRPLNLVIVGPYRTACGGCDGIKTQDLIRQSVKLAAAMAKHVLFEGVIVSTLFSGYKELADQLRQEKRGDMVWAYLDTPLDVCLARIQHRNGGKPINEALVADKVKSIEATRRKATEAGETCVTIKYKKATAQILELLK